MFPLASLSRPAEAHTASYSMGTGGPFPGVKRGRSVTLTTHNHPVRDNECVATIPPLPLDNRAVAGQLYFFLHYTLNETIQLIYIKLSARRSVHFQELVLQFSHFMEPKGSLPCLS
jgi:hypothetical protein